jgi:hypothetical protein
MAIEAFAPLLPELIGGSADLAHSNLTLWKGSKSVTGGDANANYVYYGVREFGDDRDQQRPRAARRLHPLRRHLPGVQRLRAQRGAHERADGHARASTSTPTTRSAWAKTARPTSRSSTWRRCATSRTTTSGAPATRWSRR